MGFVAVIFNALVGTVLKYAQFVMRFAVFGFLIAAVVSFFVWFLGFVSDVYNVIFDYVDQIGNLASSGGGSGAIGCLFSVLGIDSFLTSAFAIFYTAAGFWLVALANITAYKMGLFVYSKALVVMK